jgi:hypothetical protein
MRYTNIQAMPAHGVPLVGNGMRLLKASAKFRMNFQFLRSMRRFGWMVHSGKS